MKLAWIEDLLALSQAGTFSRAAAQRNITQPAFSRRIQMLENWLDIQLVDRQATPLRLTPAAQRHIGDFRRLLADVHQLRSCIQAETAGAVRVVLSTQHSLTMTRLPPLLERLSAEKHPRVHLVVRSENRDECVDLFTHGEADLLLCMEEPDSLLSGIMPQTRRMGMGTETLIPVSAAGANGRPFHGLSRQPPLRLLTFPPDSFLGRLLYRNCLDALAERYPIEIVHESVFLAGIKEMVLAGLGIGWLPASMARRELMAGSLVALGGGMKRLHVELGLYRHTGPAQREPVERIWSLLADCTLAATAA